MLSLLSFERVDADATELQWFLPSSVLPSAVENSLSALNQFLTAPPEVEDPKKLLRRKRKTKVREDADGEAPVRAPRVRKAAEVQTYKSAAFIEDSDDEDPEVTAAFFAREEELRRQMSAAAEANGHTMRRTGTKKRKRGDKKGTAAVGAAEGGEVGSDGDVPMDQQSDSDGESDGYASESSDDDDQPPARRRKSVLGDPDESDVSVSGTPAASAVAPRPRTQRIIDSD
jgi:replication fork protection complex subunit Tof1/Swi1